MKKTSILLIALTILAAGMGLYIFDPTRFLIVGLIGGASSVLNPAISGIQNFILTNPIVQRYGFYIALAGGIVFGLIVGAKVGIEGWKKATGWGASRVNTLLQKDTATSGAAYNPAVTSPSPAPATNAPATKEEGSK